MVGAFGFFARNLPDVVDFEQRREKVVDFLREEGVGNLTAGMVLEAEADKLVFARWFEYAVDAPNEGLAVFRGYGVEATTVENQGEATISIGKLKNISRGQRTAYSRLRCLLLAIADSRR